MPDEKDALPSDAERGSLKPQDPKGQGPSSPPSDDTEEAVDWASSKAPLENSEHIDPAKARRSVERSMTESKATPKNEGGAAPIEAKPNRDGECDNRQTEPISENVKSQSAHEKVEEKMRSRG